MPIKEIINKEGEVAELRGWVDVRRNLGKIIFIDLRDRSGIVQLVFTPPKDSAKAGSAEQASKNKILYETAEQLRPEWVIKVSGKINKRPAGMENPNIETGYLEMLVENLEVLSQAKNLPIDISKSGTEISEEIRMKYRYLDLRRNRLLKNMEMRHKVIKFARDYLSDRGFMEIETPILTKSTPEGARDFLTPSRLEKGKFYALPQSPQQYKQLLMVSGLEKYFQIARCFRDEDTRGDRQPEFTQLDIEMSFVEENDVMTLVEEMFIDMIKKLYPQKTIQTIPFPRLTYKEAMEKYNTDRPDLRNDKNDLDLLAFCWITDFPFFEKADDGGWVFTHNPFSAPKKECAEKFMNKENIGDILTTQYDIALNGYEVGGGSIRNHNPEALKKTFEIMGFDEQRIMENFGHMIEALSYGAPPHGGIAPGMDRLIMILQNEPNIREVIAFPKTGDGRDLMMSSPSEVDKKQLDDLGISIIKRE